MSRDADLDARGGDGLRQVEAMVRAAGDYVGPSDDLRPRLLESVRGARRSEERRRLLLSAVAPAMILTLLLSNQWLEVSQALTEASPRRQIDRTMSSHRSDVEGGVQRQVWKLADAFYLVKQRHIEAFARDAEPDPAGESADSPRFDARASVSDPSE